MLIGQINPAASFVKQQNPFQQPTTVVAPYISVSARPYIAGASSTNFNVIFFKGEVTEQGALTKLQRVSDSIVTLTSEELSSWGTDDSVLLNLVASKLGEGVTVTNTYTVEDRPF